MHLMIPPLIRFWPHTHIKFYEGIHTQHTYVYADLCLSANQENFSLILV